MVSKWEEKLAFQISALKLPVPVREVHLIKGRRNRCDFVWPDHNLVVEVEGGVYSNGAHVRGKRFTLDCEKYNRITLDGYRVLRVTPEHVKSGKALEWIEEAISCASIN